MLNIPVEVDDDETIVRIVIDKYHVKRGRLHRNMFRGANGVDLVSVIRHTYRDADFCKRHAKERVQNINPPNPRLYVGLAALGVGVVRSLGGYVVDSRDEFLGHADLGVGIARPAGEPPDPEQLAAFNERADSLVARARYYPDPAPDSDGWKGGPLLPG